MAGIPYVPCVPWLGPPNHHGQAASGDGLSALPAADTADPGNGTIPTQHLFWFVTDVPGDPFGWRIRRRSGSLAAHDADSRSGGSQSNSRAGLVRRRSRPGRDADLACSARIRPGVLAGGIYRLTRASSGACALVWVHSGGGSQLGAQRRPRVFHESCVVAEYGCRGCRRRERDDGGVTRHRGRRRTDLRLPGLRRSSGRRPAEPQAGRAGGETRIISGARAGRRVCPGGCG